jgi:alpha-tubulin suppressor-like RCC1 family protein
MKHRRLTVDGRGGFALPTVLIASIVMLMVLVSAISSIGSVSVAIDGQYYNQLAREAAEAGEARAIDCLKQSPTSTPQWSDASPLLPNTNCDGTTNTSYPNFVLNSANIRTSFRVGLPATGAGSATRVAATGSVSLVRSSSGNSVWRTYSQSISQDSRYAGGSPKISGGAGWQSNGHIGAMLTTQGQVYAYGDNGGNEITDNRAPNPVTTPQQLVLPTGVASATKVLTAGQGGVFLCIIANTGDVYCRGMPGANETNGVMYYPIVAGWIKFALPNGVSGTDMTINGSGPDQMCVLGSDSNAYCAGYNSVGQIGNATSGNFYHIDQAQKFAVPGSPALRKIYTTSDITCGITTTNLMYCSGYNYENQINGSGGMITTPAVYVAPGVPQTSPGYRQVDDVLVSYHTNGHRLLHVLTTDGYIWSSGDYTNGDAGNGATSGTTASGASWAPAEFTTGQKNFLSGSEMYNSTANKCMDNSGNGYSDATNGNPVNIWDCSSNGNYPNQTWMYTKNNQFSVLGTGWCLDIVTPVASGSKLITKPCSASTTQQWTIIGGIGGNTVKNVAATNAGLNLCIDNPSGGTTNGTQMWIYTCNSSPAQSWTRWATYNAWRGMVAGTDHFCAIRDDQWSGMWCAGGNSYGELANYADSTRNFQGQCVGTPSGGYNFFNVNTPGGVAVDWSKLSSEWKQQYNSLMVIGKDGNIYGAGENTYGKLGNGAAASTSCVTTQMQLPGGVTAQDLSARDEYTSYVLGSDGKIYASGRNNNGQIGDGTTTDRKTPVLVRLPPQALNY